MKLTIAQIVKELEQIKDPGHHLFQTLLQDERKGVQKLVARWHREWSKAQDLKEKFIEMNAYEEKCRKNGFKAIAGIDEVGRGPLAGPVVAAAVILPEDFYLPGIDDSKKLTEQKREEYATVIRREAIAVGVSFIGPEMIDAINIYEATKVAMTEAISALQFPPDFLLIDAMKLDTVHPFEPIIKGDAKSISIAAASIVAKVERDCYMKQLALHYPEYGFQNHMGYGTKEHLKALESHGVTPYHRKSFAPIKQMVVSK